MSRPRKSAAHLTKLHIKQMALKMYLSQYEKYIKIIVKIQIFRYIRELSQNSGMNRKDLSTPNGTGVKRMLENAVYYTVTDLIRRKRLMKGVLFNLSP